MHCDMEPTSGPKYLSPKAWDDYSALCARVDDTLMAMDLASHLQKVQRVTFSIGVCPFSVWMALPAQFEGGSGRGWGHIRSLLTVNGLRIPRPSLGTFVLHLFSWA